MARFSNTQRLIWTGQALHPGTPLYNMGRAFVIEGELDHATFERAWQSVVDRSDALRTVVDVIDGTPRPRVRSDMSGGLRHLDLTDRRHPEDEAARWATEACRRLLDPAQRLFDTALIRLRDDRWMWYLNQHHLITDAWSANVVYRRTGEAYAAAESAGAADGERWPAFQEYVDHERSLAATPRFQAAEAYWVEQFGKRGTPAPFYGRPRPATTRSTRVTRRLGAEQSERITAFASRPGVASLTPHLSQFNVFAAVLAAFMARVTADRTVTFGVVSHNRPSPAFQQTIGALLELLPMRVRATPGETWLSMLDKVKEASNAFLSHAQPGIGRAEYHSHCNATLNYLGVALPDFAGRPAYSEPIHPGHADAHHALRLHVRSIEATGELELLFDCNEDVFDATQRDEAVGHFMKLLDGFLDAPESRLDDVDVLSDVERRRLLVAWNASPEPPPEGETILSRFAAQVAQRGDRQAVVAAGGGTGLTYERLDRLARSLARRLVALGAGPGAPVGVCMPPGVGSIVAIIAALRAGAAFVPIDHKNPRGRVDRMLRDAKAAALVVDRSAALKLPATCAAVDWRDGAAEPDGPVPGATIDPGEAAYIYFTSGSTGTPKGVRCGHTGLLNLLDEFAALGPLEDAVAATWWTSIGFDVSAYEIFGALLSGHTLHVIPEPMRGDTQAFVRYLRDASIQSAYVPPFMLDALAEACEADPAAFDLRRILVGVEPIPERLLRRITRRLGRLKLINGYGPTEATTCATLYPVGTDKIPDRTTPIGRPVRNNQIYVLNERGRPQPAGVPGELCIGGTGLALGYVDPADEAGRFVPNPFGGTDRLYRTGDLARLLPDGNLAFLGRIDHQIKLGGFRIEPGEVEFALNRQPDVDASVVVALGRSGPPGRGAAKRLVAYVVPRPGTAIEPSDLRNRLRTDLPPYMVPSALVVMERLPMTANGKVDRAALPEPPAVPVDADDAAQPTNQTERALAEIWSTVLGVDQVGIHDGLFELGGDSIAAIQIVAQANRAGLAIALKDIFDGTTIARLARAAGQAQPTAAARVVGAVGLTPIQRWFLDTHGLAGRFHQLVRAESGGPLHEAPVAACLAELADHHDALRQSFHRTAGGWASRVAGRPETPPLRSFASEREAREWLEQPFDLGSPPLLRAALLTGEPARLLLAAHHLIVDMVTWATLVDDLSHLLRGRTAGDQAPLAPVAASLRDWVEALEAKAAGLDPGRWRSLVTAAAPAALPGGEGAATSTVRIELDRDATAPLLDAAVERRIATDELLAAALALALADSNGAGAQRLFLEGHGREAAAGLPDVSRTMGWFTNLYPVVLATPRSAEPVQAALGIRDELRRAAPAARDYGLVRHLHPDPAVRAGVALPHADHVVFNYLGRTGASPKGSGELELSGPLELVRGECAPSFAAEVGAMAVDGQLVVKWTSARTDRAVVEAAAQRMVRHASSIAAELAARTGDATPGDFPLAGLDDTGLAKLADVLEASDGGR